MEQHKHQRLEKNDGIPAAKSLNPVLPTAKKPLVMNTKLVVKGMILLGMILSGCALAPSITQAPSAVPPTSTPTPSAGLSPTDMQPPPTGTREGPITIAFVPSYMGNPYFDTANQGAQEAAAELGIEVMYRGSSFGDVAEQSTLIQSLIAQGVDGLAISASNADALVPDGQDALDQGIPVVSWGSDLAEEARTLHVKGATWESLWRVQIEIASRLAGSQGQIAVLCEVTTSGDTGASFYSHMYEILEEDEYQGLELLDQGLHYSFEDAYEDDDEMIYNDALSLLVDYPDLEVIVAPTTVGIAAAARAVQDRGQIGQVFVTGLGTPNQMREYVKSGASPEFVLWNPIDLGYLTIYATYHLVSGDITGEPGDEFEAGRLGNYTVKDGVYDLPFRTYFWGSEVLLGTPYIYNADNIDDFDF